MIELSVVSGALLVGFIAGYFVRTALSRLRRQRWLRDQGWQS
jgi:fructose-specific phosphotransferase system IIC component